MSASDHTKPYFPVAGIARDGWSKDGRATATCFCGSVQLSVPVEGPGYVGSFVCHCSDCRKITASTFASNFTVLDSHLEHLRGKELLKVFKQAETTTNGNSMANHFCSNCGTLMYRIGSGFPGMSICRIGTVDDFSLAETKLRPQKEMFIKNRAGWLHEMEGVEHFDGSGFA